MSRILAINPGGTSTKIGVFDDDKVILKTTIEHQGSELGRFKRVLDQLHFRVNVILNVLEENIRLDSLDAIVGRGGLLKPVTSGTYIVNEAMLEDLGEAKRGEHASNLGPVIAHSLAFPLQIPAYTVDPVSVDEMEAVARISGMPELPRLSLPHAMNHKAVSRTVAKEMGAPYETLNFVVAHLGSGITVSAHKEGRMIDVNSARDEGPFSTDRCGGLPAWSLMKLCYSGKYTENEMNARIMGSGGIYAYLGTRDIREAERRATEGEETAGTVIQALAYQVAKEIGAMATVLRGHVDRIILTGGISYSEKITGMIKEMVQFIAPVVVVAGEEELEALAAGALRVLKGEELPRIYE